MVRETCKTLTRILQLASPWKVDAVRDRGGACDGGELRLHLRSHAVAQLSPLRTPCKFGGCTLAVQQAIRACPPLKSYVSTVGVRLEYSNCERCKRMPLYFQCADRRSTVVHQIPFFASLTLLCLECSWRLLCFSASFRVLWTSGLSCVWVAPPPPV